jgi:hypothetical protein
VPVPLLTGSLGPCLEVSQSIPANLHIHLNASEVADLPEAFAMSILGPEFKTENVESSQNRSVVKLTMCPLHERAKEMN